MSKLLLIGILLLSCCIASNAQFSSDKDIVEGDIKVLKSSKSLGERFRKWPNGIVPYVIDSIYTIQQRNIILSAMNLISRKTGNGCITFIPRDSRHPYYLYITSLNGCFSYVGKIVQNGPQRISLSIRGCVNLGIAVHEICHALGFYHEQNRPDRDAFIRVNYNNINPNFTSNFNKYYNRETFNTPYDYYSIMHYDEYSFSRNGLKTIEPLQSGVTLLNAFQKTEAQILSNYDILAIRTLYECTNNQVSTTTTTTTTTTRPTTTTRLTTITSSRPSIVNPTNTQFVFRLINDYRQNMYLYWIDFRGKPIYQGRIPPRTSVVRQSFNGYSWIVVPSNFRYYSFFKAGEGLLQSTSSVIRISQLFFYDINQFRS